jgi:hypothetical protein
MVIAIVGFLGNLFRHLNASLTALRANWEGRLFAWGLRGGPRRTPLTS